MSNLSHVVISGTGRAGTTFLVSFLEACGLDTGNGNSLFHDRARLGLETQLTASESLPYVVKDPWLATYCDSLDMSEIPIDALVVPVRSLRDAAESRLLQDRLDLSERDPATSDRMISGYVPGGAIYSLENVDQERLLAVNFFTVVHWALRNDLPLLFLEFPRLIDDAHYLVSRLWPVLKAHTSETNALQVHRALADESAVRFRGHKRVDDTLDRRALVERIKELETALEVQSKSVPVGARIIARLRNSRLRL